jgi:formylglycine-generating enzyme required for sulfatase activity
MERKMKIKRVFLAAILAAVLCISGNLCAACPSMDFTGDCRVGFADFAIFASQWLDEGSYTLHVNSNVVSGISISSSTGHGGTTNYTQTLTVGTSVTLTALAIADYSDFMGWTGDINSSNQTISLEMDADKTVTANYEPTNMVLVPAGWFKYQNHATADTYCASFTIDRYEVTNAQYCEYLNSGQPGSDSRWSSSMEIARFGSSGSYTYSVQSGKEQFPIRYVSAFDAEAFAAWKSATYGGTYRLPTEQEWEKAAGWDPVIQKLWTYGCQRDSIDCTWVNFSNCYGMPLAIGSFNGTDGKNLARSYYGCYDMSGNVMEWTSSMYDASYRVIRDGVWNLGATFCTVTFRYYNLPSGQGGNFGFRLVMSQ